MKLTPITAAINHLLTQEPWARRILATHADKVVYIDGGALALKWQVSSDGLLQVVGEDIATNVTIRINLADLPLIAQNRERAFAYVKIDGDADFANAISQIAQSLRWDAERDMSGLVGDIAAVRIVTGVKSMLATAGATQQKLAENLAEYFLEEKPLLVRPQAVTELTQDVTKLRDDVERLAKRINKLKMAHS